MLNLAIIGVGYWGPNFARLSYEIPQVNLVWCADKDMKVLSAFKRRFPWVKTTQNYIDILDDKTVDAIIVVTPAQTHFRIVRDSLNAGKHVLVEKPLTTSSLTARQLIQHAKKQKKILMVDHTFLFNSAVSYLKKTIAQGNLGNIIYGFGAYTALGPIRRDVNVLWDVGPHFCYLIPYITGHKIKSVCAVGLDYLMDKMVDVVFATFELSENIKINLHLSWIFPEKVRNLVIVGDKKMVIFDDVSPDEKIKIFDKGAELNSKNPNFADLQIVYRQGDIIIPRITPREPLKESLKHFISCIQNKSQPIADAESGYSTVLLLEAIMKSMAEEGKKINL